LAISSTSGAQVFIGPVNSTADTKTAYASLSYTEIGEVESIGEFGDQASTVTFTSLSDARVRKRKGVRDAGDLALVVGHDPLDEGQIACTAAQATDFSYAFKVIIADAADANDPDSVFYFRALVSNARIGIGAANAINKRNYALLIDSKIVEVLSVATP
jgi:hypothetical protein